MYPVPSSDFLLPYPKNTRFDSWYWVIELTFESWYHCTTANYRDSSVRGYHDKTVLPCGVSPCPCSWDKTVCGQPVSSVARALPLSHCKPKIIPVLPQYYCTFYEKHSNKWCVFLGGGLPLIISEPEVSRDQCRSHLTSSRAIFTLLIVRLWCSAGREWHDVHTKLRGNRSVKGKNWDNLQIDRQHNGQVWLCLSLGGRWVKAELRSTVGSNCVSIHVTVAHGFVCNFIVYVSVVCVFILCVFILCVFILCVFILCVFMCLYTMCLYTVCLYVSLYYVSLYCVSLCLYTVCLYVSLYCVSLCVFILCVFILCLYVSLYCVFMCLYNVCLYVSLYYVSLCLYTVSLCVFILCVFMSLYVSL